MRFLLLALATLAGCLLGALPAAAQIGVGVNIGTDGAVPSVGVSVGVSAGTPGPSTASGNVTDPTGFLDQNMALEAVRTGRALPLEQIMARAQLEAGGEIVDAKLIAVNAFLLYELTVVSPDGDVREIYFYARSGERVRTN